MCGTRLRQCLLISALLLLPLWPSYSDGEVYEITAEELAQLETTLTQQSETIDELRSTLRTQEATISALNDSLTTQQTTIETLRTSLTEYEREARNRTIRAALYGGIGGLAVGAIGALILAY